MAKKEITLTKVVCQDGTIDYKVGINPNTNADDKVQAFVDALFIGVNMSEQLSELPLRYAERILVSSFNHLHLSERDKIPAFETMPELLNWIHSWLQNQYLNNSSKTDDISLCIRAVQYIQEHVTESVRAEAAADAVGMSRGYFSTKFREVTGETFHNCVIRYKMKTAAQEIRKGEKSMTEIALELGYDNFYYFSKLFRKEYGCTPGEF